MSFIPKLYTIPAMNNSKKKLIPLLAGLMALQPLNKAANANPVATAMPNQHGKSLTTPVGWGAYGNVIFAGIGATTPSPYSPKSDGAAVLGGGIGDPVKNVGVQAYITSIDITEWKEYSASLHLFKKLTDASALGVGVENQMITNGGDSDRSLYIVYSQGVQADSFVNQSSGYSKLHFSVGAGSGRFANKSPQDILNNKGKDGTVVFGNIAYEIADSFNLITDWNGTNLNVGVSKTFWRCHKYPIVVTLGAADLTDNSSDRVRLVGAIGTGFKIN
jgi:hypothetical protein